MNALTVAGLSVSYGPIRAVRDVSLHVAEGQVAVVLGANGAGKTTILRSIFGLQKAEEGSVTLFDQEIHRLRADQISRRGLAWVPEGRQIWATLTVEQNLMMGAYARARDPQVGDNLHQTYERFPLLGQRRSQLAGSCSGGEQQMLAIARALMARPRVLMMDEPSLGLAPMVVRSVFDLVNELHADGMSILMVEQNARQALQVADYAYLMKNGSIVKSGAAQDLAEDDDVRRAYMGG